MLRARSVHARASSVLPASAQLQTKVARTVSGFSTSAPGAGPTDVGDGAARTHKRARLLRLVPEPDPVDPVLPASAAAPQQGAGAAGAGAAGQAPLSAYEQLPPGEPSAADVELDGRDDVGALLLQQQQQQQQQQEEQPLQQQHVGAFFGSRGAALRRLKSRQLAWLSRAARPPGRRAAVAEPGAAQAAPAAAPPAAEAAAPGPGSAAIPAQLAYRYKVHEGQIVAAAALQQWQQRQQQLQQLQQQQQQQPQQQHRRGLDRQVSGDGGAAASLAEDIRLLLEGAEGEAARDWGAPSSLEATSSEPPPAATPPPGPGVSLCVFTYCVPRTGLRRALWEAGLPPGALVFVDAVADADFVLHLRPAPGERQFAYDELREQARSAGVPFLTLRSLNPRDLVDRLERARQLLASRRGRRGMGGQVLTRGKQRRRGRAPAAGRRGM